MLTFLFLLLLLYALLIAGLYLFQRRLMYHPDTQIGAPEQYGLQGFTEYFVTAPDGTRLQLWHRRALPGFPTIAYFHGNAANIANRADIYARLATKGFGVLALSYRGYGKSEGRPDEQGLYTDARAAIGFLTGEQRIPISSVMLYGESLGTGVAVQMASEYKVGALILQAPYTSVVGRAAEMYRYAPVRLLVKDRYDSIDKIEKVTAPLLMFHGELDPVIPISHGRALFAAAHEPKRAFFFPERAHNDFDNAVISAHVLNFANQYALIES